jgi:hypothetical protein
MKHFNSISRRGFLAAAVAGTGGLLAGGFMPVRGEEIGAGKRQVNPRIDNLRVVCCRDPAMIREDPRNWDFASQNVPVNADKVRAAMNAMACSLAKKNTPAAAWAAVFQKPAAKTWAKVKVAIKVNAFAKNNPRVAVVDAVCRALLGLGVQPSNILVYDGTCNAKEMYGPFIGNGLPAGIKASVKNDLLGGMVKTDVPAPYAGKFKCSAALANGTIDILVNIATNKGSAFAGTTMTMKNHAGTFEPMPIHFGGGLKYIIAFNKSEAILGGTPVRQQLCIVDSLWAMTKGPFGVPNKRPCALSMGTFSPAVDYVVARRIREPDMGCKHPESLNRIMSEFGYSGFEHLDFITVNPV